MFTSDIGTARFWKAFEVNHFPDENTGLNVQVINEPTGDADLADLNSDDSSGEDNDDNGEPRVPKVKDPSKSKIKKKDAQEEIKDEEESDNNDDSSGDNVGDEADPTEDEDDNKDEDNDDDDDDDEEEDVDDDEDKDTNKNKKLKKEEDKDKNLFTKLKDIDKDIYKKIPELRTIVGQHQQFIQHFDSPDAAAEAVTMLDGFTRLETELQNGNATNLFKAFSTNKDVLNHLAEGMLDQLYEVDRQAYFKAMTPQFHDLIRSFYEEGESTGNKDMVASAKWLSKYLTKSFDIPAAKRGPDPEVEKARKERDEVITATFNRELNRIGNEAAVSMDADIVKIFDPKKALPKKTHDAILADIRKALNAELLKDKAYLARMDRLKDSARRSQFSKGEDASIKNAFLARVKPLVGTVTRKVMEEWNVVNDNETGKGRKTSDKNENQEKKPQKRIGGGGNKEAGAGITSDKGGRGYDPNDVDFKKTSDLDLMNGIYTNKQGKKITFKKKYSNAN